MVLRVCQLFLLLIFPFILNNESLSHIIPFSNKVIDLLMAGTIYIGIFITYADYVSTRKSAIQSWKDALKDPYLIFALFLFLIGIKKNAARFFNIQELYSVPTSIFIGVSFLWAVLLFVCVVFAEAIYQFITKNNRQILFCNKQTLAVSWIMLGYYWKWSTSNVILMGAIIILVLDTVTSIKTKRH